MTEDAADNVIRQAIGGDANAIAWIAANAETTDDAVTIAMAALLERQPDRLVRGSAPSAT